MGIMAGNAGHFSILQGQADVSCQGRRNIHLVFTGGNACLMTIDTEGRQGLLQVRCCRGIRRMAVGAAVTGSQGGRRQQQDCQQVDEFSLRTK